MLLPCTSTSSHPVSSGAGSTSAHGTSARLTYRRRNRSVNGQRHWYVWSATHAWPVIRGGCPSTAKLSGTKPSHQSPSSREAWIRSSSPHARYSRWVQNSLSVNQTSQGHSVSPIGPIGGSTPAGDNVVHPAAHLVDARALDVQLATDAALPLALRVAGPARRSGGALRGRGPWMGSGMLGPPSGRMPTRPAWSWLRSSSVRPRRSQRFTEGAKRVGSQPFGRRRAGGLEGGLVGGRRDARRPGSKGS